MRKAILKIGFFAAVIFIAACSGDSNPGYEFMPNMYRSPSLETYGENNANGMNALTPVEGTVARGHLNTFNYDETLEGYLAAGKNAVNPIENNEKNITSGKALYGMFCEHVLYKVWNSPQVYPKGLMTLTHWLEVTTHDSHAWIGEGGHPHPRPICTA